MMLRIFTDPHLGYRPTTNATTASQKRFTEILFEQALKAVADSPHPVLCLGDLFDTYSNREDVIGQGLKITQGCSAVLQGNHDVKNLKTEPSTLTLLSEIEGDVVVVNPDPSQACVVWPDDNVCMIPHHFTQAEFEVAVLKACSDPRASDAVLCLHCNVMEPMGAETAALYLTPRLQAMAQAKFKLVLVGHEHNARREGNLLILGSTFPLSFGQMTDKFFYDVDLQTGEVTPHLIWSPKGNYVEVDVQEFLQPGWGSEAQFIRVLGKISHEQKLDLQKSKLGAWKSCPNALLISTDKVEVEGTVAAVRTTDLTNLEASLRDAAKRAGFAELFDEVYQEVGELG